MTDPVAVGDLLIDAIAERVTERVARVLEAPPVPAIERHFYSVEEAAESLGLSPSGVRRLIGDGTIASVLLGGRRLIPIEELRRLGREFPRDASQGSS